MADINNKHKHDQKHDKSNAANGGAKEHTKHNASSDHLKKEDAKNGHVKHESKK